jgi:hypothetical protein
MSYFFIIYGDSWCCSKIFFKRMYRFVGHIKILEEKVKKTKRMESGSILLIVKEYIISETAVKI